MDKQFLNNFEKFEDETMLRIKYENKLNELLNINTKLESENYVLKDEN